MERLRNDIEKPTRQPTFVERLAKAEEVNRIHGTRLEVLQRRLDRLTRALSSQVGIDLPEEPEPDTAY